MTTSILTAVQAKGVKDIYLNISHFLDRYFMLIFATVAAIALSAGWGMT